MAYFVRGSHAYEPHKASTGRKVKPSAIDRKRQEIQLCVKPQLSGRGWEFQAFDLISSGPIVAKTQ